MKCIFCEIIKGESPAHVIWQDKKHIAFLSTFPNTDGFTVLATKKHHPSYAFDTNDSVLKDLTLAAKKVAKKIDRAFEDVGRTGLIIEGFGVDHLHIKLFPMHDTKGKWQKRSSAPDKFFQKYEGYIASHDYRREDDKKLTKIAKLIREAK